MTRKVKSKTDANNNRLMIIIGVVVVAIVLIAGFIFFLSPSNSSLVDFSGVPQSRTDDGAFVAGNPDAAITIVAWEDFLCPHCQAYQPELKRFFTDYVLTGKAKFEFRMLPISQSSIIIFGLVECSDTLESGSFFKGYETMFHITSTDGFTEHTGRDFAKAMGMNYGDLLTCASSATQYQTDEQYASSFKSSDGTALVTGTPTVGWRLNGSEVRFDGISRQPSYAELSALIKAFSGQ